MSRYSLPSDEAELAGARVFGTALCAWAGRSAYRWDAKSSWTSLSPAPTAIDSGFQVRSGLLVGADKHVGFLPEPASDWAWWRDLSAFTDAHPMTGDLLLGTDTEAGTYTLFSVTREGLDERAHFEAEELPAPLAGWSAPTDEERLLLLGDDGLWALDPPYTSDSLQPLVSFDDVALPALDDIPGPFQPGVATVVIPRRHRTALRLDLSDGSGHATGLKHLSGGAALWTAYLRDDRATAARLVAALARLPRPDDGPLRLHDVLLDDGTVQAVATSAGLIRPDRHDGDPQSPLDVQSSPLDGAALATWRLWIDGDEALEAACRKLCDVEAADEALVQALHHFAGTTACRALFSLLTSPNPPSGPSGTYDYPVAALRAFAAPYEEAVASLVEEHLSDAPAPAQRAASAMAGAIPSDAALSGTDDEPTPSSLWADEASIPTETLRRLAQHDHPAVRAAARDSCARLRIDFESGTPSRHPRRSAQSSQPESPK